MNETADIRGLEGVQLGARPLVVCDVDEVALEFITPFDRFLQSRGQKLLPRSFHLTGNIVSLQTEMQTPAGDVATLLDSFFAGQLEWQTPADQVSASLSALSTIADIVFLTAMPARHYDVRRELLDRHELPFPLIATERSKGPLISQIHAERSQPLFFIDDLAHNLHSVKQHAPTANLVNYMANDVFRAMAPHPGDDVNTVSSWSEIEEIITDHVVAEQSGNDA